MKMALLLLAATVMVGCTHSLHLSHYSDFDPTYAPYQRGEWVQAESEQFVILNFAFETDYVNEAFSKLKAECPNGQVQGIQTQWSTDHGFLSWTNRIHMQGLCVRKS